MRGTSMGRGPHRHRPCGPPLRFNPRQSGTQSRKAWRQQWPARGTLQRRLGAQWPRRQAPQGSTSLRLPQGTPWPLRAPYPCPSSRRRAVTRHWCGLMPIAPHNVLRIADLRSRAATIADTFAERLTYQDAHPLRDKNTEAPEQTNTYGSHRLGDGELQPKHAQRPLQGVARAAKLMPAHEPVWNSGCLTRNAG
jgi:hypothetical protein